MKICLRFLGIFFAIMGLALAAPLCDEGSLADYIELGSTGCQIGDKLFSNFLYAPTSSGVLAPSPAEVAVVPIDTDDVGIVFASSGWTVLGPGNFMNIALLFSLTVLDPARTITGATLISAGTGIAGGTVNVEETVVDDADPSGNNLLLASSIPGIPVSIGNLNRPARTVIVVKNILIATQQTTSPDALAAASLVIQRFSQTEASIPEPGGLLMCVVGATAFLIRFQIGRKPASRWLP